MDPAAAPRIAALFDLGDEAILDPEAVRGELGQVQRLTTSRGTYAVKESFDPVDHSAAEASARFQVACHDAGVPCPRPMAALDGGYLAIVDEVPVRVQTWTDLADPDPALDPAVVGTTSALLHRVAAPTGGPAHPWYTEAVGHAEWRALVKASRAAGAPYAEQLADLVPHLLEVERILAPMTPTQWCHLDLFADNLRGTPTGGVCVIDFDNAGPGDPSRELALVLFEFARGDGDPRSDARGGVPGAWRRRASAGAGRLLDGRGAVAPHRAPPAPGLAARTGSRGPSPCACRRPGVPRRAVPPRGCRATARLAGLRAGSKLR